MKNSILHGSRFSTKTHDHTNSVDVGIAVGIHVPVKTVRSTSRQESNVEFLRRLFSMQRLNELFKKIVNLPNTL